MVNLKYNIISIILCIGLIVLANSCNLQQVTNNETQDILKNFEPPIQSIILPESNEIEGKEGTKFRFEKNCFVDSLGKVPVGDIIVELQEYFSLTKMLLSNLSTVCNNKPIETRGMIKIEAFCNNKKLRLLEDAIIEVCFPRQYKNDNMFLFKGDNGTNDNYIRWEEIGQEKVWDENVFYQYDSISPEMRNAYKKSLDYYLFESSTLGWLNCDRYFDIENKTNQFVVQHGEDIRPIVKLVFKDIQSFVVGTYNDNNSVEFYNLPIGINAALFAFYQKEGKVYFSTEEFTIEDNSNISLDFKEVDKDQLKAEAEKLENYML